MSFEDLGSISGLLIVLKGLVDRAAVDNAMTALWDRYFDSSARLTKVRPRHAPSAMLDKEDVALSAINRFCRRAAEGQFPRLNNQYAELPQ
jgi:hypothetical protein